MDFRGGTSCRREWQGERETNEGSDNYKSNGQKEMKSARQRWNARSGTPSRRYVCTLYEPLDWTGGCMDGFLPKGEMPPTFPISSPQSPHFPYLPIN